MTPLTKTSDPGNSMLYTDETRSSNKSRYIDHESRLLDETDERLNRIERKIALAKIGQQVNPRINPNHHIDLPPPRQDDYSRQGREFAEDNYIRNEKQEKSRDFQESLNEEVQRVSQQFEQRIKAMITENIKKETDSLANNIEAKINALDRKINQVHSLMEAIADEMSQSLSQIRTHLRTSEDSEAMEQRVRESAKKTLEDDRLSIERFIHDEMSMLRESIHKVNGKINDIARQLQPMQSRTGMEDKTPIKLRSSLDEHQLTNSALYERNVKSEIGIRRPQSGRRRAGSFTFGDYNSGE